MKSYLQLEDLLYESGLFEGKRIREEIKVILHKGKLEIGLLK
jgi:hypothetical protein